MSPHHIPFPTAFLTVNVPVQKSSSVGSPTSTQSSIAAHGFLSNIASRPANASRHDSISSVSSVDSVASDASSASDATIAASQGNRQTLPAFLSLNTKHAAPPTTASALKDIDAKGFLSNRH